VALLGPQYIMYGTKLGASRSSKSRPKPRQQKGFTPFEQINHPPPGTYDPALDATLRGSNRGLTDFKQDTELGNTRRAVDYSLATGEIHRQFGVLGKQQLSSAAGAGLLNSGWAPQAATLRLGNMARAIAPLTLANTRAATDSATALGRAQRENRFFQGDTNQERIYQARGTGWKPPNTKRPANERSFRGQSVHVLGGKQLLLPSGQQISRGTFRRRFGSGIKNWNPVYKTHPWLRPVM
jgi:hypothetical protein